MITLGTSAAKAAARLSTQAQAARSASTITAIKVRSKYVDRMGRQMHDRTGSAQPLDMTD